MRINSKSPIWHDPNRPFIVIPIPVWCRCIIHRSRAAHINHYAINHRLAQHIRIAQIHRNWFNIRKPISTRISYRMKCHCIRMYDHPPMIWPIPIYGYVLFQTFNDFIDNGRDFNVYFVCYRKQRVHHNHYSKQVHRLKSKKRNYHCHLDGRLIIRYVVASIISITMQKPHIGHIHWNVKGFQWDGNVLIRLNMEFIMLSE